MTDAWDTTLVSRIYPGGPLEQVLLDRASAGEPVAITAPTVMETVRGLQATATRKSEMAAALRWFTGAIASDLVEILSLDRSAAILAGRLRAVQPTPPTGLRRRGTKPEQRAGWILDIQIAACAWTHGRHIATENRHDFQALSNLIATLYPNTTPLVISTSPLA
ncbi:MAG TPA: type II toxin-antitoxin system VapC family toxin [Solirubrobacteraceae bacterium]|nr:type II toxin-antitoxin system VapC family toxin [Solirubrobacteraceae bacterium]